MTRATDLAEAMHAIERAFLIGVEGATEVLLIRHGDVYDGAEEEDVDPPLSRTGREQAQRLGERLRGIELNALYASPLKRALETAKYVGLDTIAEPRLVEVETKLADAHIEVTEAPAQVVERMRGAVADAVAAHPGGRVAMIGHGVAILHYLCDVMRLEAGQLRIYPRFCGINVVRLLGERRMVGVLGDVAHLDSL